METYLDATWFVVAGKGFKGMVEIRRPTTEPETVHCKEIRDDYPAAQEDAEVLKAKMKADWD